MVTEHDLENNFFLTRDSLGRSRAEQVTAYLSELNEDVRGHHLHRNPITLIQVRGVAWCSVACIHRLISLIDRLLLLLLIM